jgi:site-specific DNA-methyltransferase (cytosine-N4-specific)
MAARPKSLSPRHKLSSVRITEVEQVQMQQEAEALGLKSLSEYIRYLHNQQLEKEAAMPLVYEYTEPIPFISTELGQAYLGDSLGLLHHTLAPESVDLIMTSPPFGLVREKSYGNKKANDYLEWFRPFAEGFKRVLKSTGSVAIDIGGSWNSGEPTRSLYHYELLIMLCKEYGFHLALEHFWWNPAKLPTPAEWVNIRRLRVKDAVNCIWWLSPTPWPKANNRRVLSPYSGRMENLLENGYDAKMRPSGHDISHKFKVNNGGAVPPNLIAAANTESNSRYQNYCKENKIPIHPARFPYQVPEYFIRMCTDPGDLVVDPFGGSCMTGEVCERLGRRWVCGELDELYLQGAQGRFPETSPLVKKASLKKSSQQPYTIYPPCVLPVADDIPLAADGGQKRAQVSAPVKKDTLPNEEILLASDGARKHLISKKPKVSATILKAEVEQSQTAFHEFLPVGEDAV